MVSPGFQNAIPTGNWMYPVTQVALPAGFNTLTKPKPHCSSPRSRSPLNVKTGSVHGNAPSAAKFRLADPRAAAACLLVIVALAAFLALWLEAPQAPGRRSSAIAISGTLYAFLSGRRFVGAVFGSAGDIPCPRLYRRRFPGRTLLLRLCAMTLILPVLVAVFGILSVYGRQGWLAALFHALGWQWDFSPYGLQGILLAHVFFNMPMRPACCCSAGKHPRRTAANRRSARHARFRLLPSCGMAVAASADPAGGRADFYAVLRKFATVLSLGGGPRATTIELAIYQALSFDYDPARAALLAIIQMICCLGLVLLSQRLSKAVAIGASQVQGWRRPRRPSA